MGESTCSFGASNTNCKSFWRSEKTKSTETMVERLQDMKSYSMDNKDLAASIGGYVFCGTGKSSVFELIVR
jgi:hypothetical protein